jgi:hypothetical protein
LYGITNPSLRLTQYSLEIMYRRRPETENCVSGTYEPTLGLPADIAF